MFGIGGSKVRTLVPCNVLINESVLLEFAINLYNTGMTSPDASRLTITASFCINEFVKFNQVKVSHCPIPR